MEEDYGLSSVKKELADDSELPCGPGELPCGPGELPCGPGELPSFILLQGSRMNTVLKDIYLREEHYEEEPRELTLINVTKSWRLAFMNLDQLRLLQMRGGDAMLLPALPSLCTLNMQSLPHLMALPSLPKVQTLKLHHLKLKRLPRVMNELTVLHLKDCPNIQDIAYISMPKLKGLRIIDCPNVSIPPPNFIPSIVKLRYKGVHRTPGQNEDMIFSLGDYPHLMTLDLSGSKGIHNIEDMPSLAWLYADNSEIIDVTRCPVLQGIQAHDSQLEDLNDLHSLRILEADRSNLTSVESLSLVTLSARDCPLTSLIAPRLTSKNIEGTPLSKN